MPGVGYKYIIEIGEKYESRIDTLDKEEANAPATLFRIKGFNSLVFDENGLSKLEEYKGEEYECGWRDAQDETHEKVTKAYQRGLNDAWEAARKIGAQPSDGGLEIDDLPEIFGTMDADWIVGNITAAEAIEKIRAYEERKNAEETEIRIGDEVEITSGEKAVVIEISGNTTRVMRVMFANAVVGHIHIRNVKKTGRHFPQIAELLEQMQE